jgi:hypothetical protein
MYTINYPVTIDVKLLLKGSDTSADQNIDIFIKVQNYILKKYAGHLLFWVLIRSLKIFRDLEFRVSIGSLFHNLMDDGRK